MQHKSDVISSKVKQKKVRNKSENSDRDTQPAGRKQAASVQEMHLTS